MPIYEYKCASCDHLEEVLQKFSDPPPDPCPECGAKGSMSKEVSITSFQLKGGGWYNDLYSSVPKGDDGDKKKASAESSDSSTESKTKAKDKTTKKKESSSTKKPSAKTSTS